MFPLLDDCLNSLRHTLDTLPEQRRARTVEADGDQPNFEKAVDWMEETTLHPFAIAILIMAIGVILTGKRRHAVLAYLFVACCVSGAQNINFLGTSLYLLRILIACGALRCFFRREWCAMRWCAMDTFTAACAIVGTIIFVIQRGEPGALVYKVGAVVDAAGAYYVFRCLLQSREDVEYAILSFAGIALPVSVAFLFERATQFNLFSAFGGVPAVTVIREGRLRCQGAFSHPILAGVFWATILPTFIAMVISGRSRILAGLASVACLLIIIACSSSTPVLGVGVGLLGLGFFVLRNQMRVIQYAALSLLCILHVTMKAPVWHLLARGDVLGGSTGHYRYLLVDATIHFFHEWWLVGLASNEHWGQAYGHYLTDITNQYIIEGLRGGAATLVLFVAVIWTAFASIGRRLRSNPVDNRDWLMWSLGVALFVHCVSFMGVSYFGQSIMLYQLHLAMIASLPAIASAKLPQQDLALQRASVARFRATVVAPQLQTVNHVRLG